MTSGVIVIYGIRDQLVPKQAPISDALHACMREVLGLPEGKRFHRFLPLERDGFYYGDGRTDAYTVIEIRMMEGRTVATKKALIHAIFARLQADVGLSPMDVEITILEQPAHCWGFRGITGDEARLDYKIEV